jgi:hypothetical protein
MEACRGWRAGGEHGILKTYLHRTMTKSRLRTTSLTVHADPSQHYCCRDLEFRQLQMESCAPTTTLISQKGQDPFLIVSTSASNDGTTTEPFREQDGYGHLSPIEPKRQSSSNRHGDPPHDSSPHTTPVRYAPCLLTLLYLNASHR